MPNGVNSIYVPSTKIQTVYGIGRSTLTRLADNKTVRCVRIGAKGKRLYHFNDVRRFFGDEPVEQTPQKKEKYIYARVSSAKQKPDLDRQIRELQSAYPHHKLITDIGSGIHFKRRGCKALLGRVFKNMVAEVVVLYKDRLCRFGGDLVAQIFAEFGVKLVVHGEENHPEATHELAEDLLAITTVFVARHNGKRSAQNKARRKRKRQQAAEEREPDFHRRRMQHAQTSEKTTQSQDDETSQRQQTSKVVVEA